MHSCSKCSTWLQEHWQQPKALGWVLWPFSIIFSVIAAIRKFIYKNSAYKATVPIIIVGNITVGGTGKTPTVIALVSLLKQAGYNPGIVTRGYKGTVTSATYVNENSDPKEVGDEAVMLAGRTQCPVVVAPKRAEAVKLLQDKVDVIVSDDGLQHYKLARDIEIVVVDGEKKFGNGYSLPMGPLRETEKRLQTVDFVLENGTDIKIVPEEELDGKGETIHAVAGIGNPNRFFQMLRDAGFNVIPHSFSDHYTFHKKDLQFAEKHSIYMTEKDAVKCKDFHMNLHVVKVDAKLPEKFCKDFINLLKEKVNGRS